LTFIPLKNNPEESGRILKNARTVTIFTLFSRILGAARDLVIAHVFGAGWVTDAFVQAFTIPNVLRRLTAEGSMTLAFLPLYTEIRERKDPEAAKKFAAKTLGLVLAATTILTGLGILFSPQLVYLFAAGFASSPEKYDLTVLLTRVMFPYLIFVSLVAWAMGVLNAEGRFAAPAAAPILLNIGIIGAAFGISPLLEEPMIGIGIGVLLGGIAQILIQIPSLRKVGQSFKPQNFLNDENIQRLLKLLGPSLLGVAVYQINIIVLRNLASFMPTGQVTHYCQPTLGTDFGCICFCNHFSRLSGIKSAHCCRKLGENPQHPALYHVHNFTGHLSGQRGFGGCCRTDCVNAISAWSVCMERRSKYLAHAAGFCIEYSCGSNDSVADFSVFFT